MTDGRFKNVGKEIDTKLIFQHNIFVKQMNFGDANVTYCGHHHDYDHVTLVASGKVRVKFAAVPEAGIPEEVKEYTGVSTFITRSFREHEITSLEPNTVVCCVHAVREENGEIVVPEVDDEHRHDPDHKFHGWGDIEKIVGKKPQRMAFTAQPVDLDKMIRRADEEGTLVTNSADKLL